MHFVVEIDRLSALLKLENRSDDPFCRLVEGSACLSSSVEAGSLSALRMSSVHPSVQPQELLSVPLSIVVKWNYAVPRHGLGCTRLCCCHLYWASGYLSLIVFSSCSTLCQSGIAVTKNVLM
jgi:hypothetical protein